MNKIESITVPSAPLARSVADFLRGEQPNVLDRWLAHQQWWDARLQADVDPYNKAVLTKSGPRVKAAYRDGRAIEGINFASQDYLSLSGHPVLATAVVRAMEEFGVHSAGSATLMGNTPLSWALEREVADFLDLADCTLYSTGWGAGYGVIRALVRPDDHIVIDALAHACLHEGARSATRNVATVPHLSVDAIRRRLSRMRSNDAKCGIVVITESVFSMDSDVPDLLAIQETCHEYGATLILDVAHDLGALGPCGRGILEIQGALGRVDVVMGSFSKTFASNGGFVASNHPALKLALRANSPTQTFTNAMAPIASAIILGALKIVRGAEGNVRRDRLMSNILHLRKGLANAGFKVLGQPSAIVPVVLGDPAFSRRISSYTISEGALVNLVEYPAVSRNGCRWRLQVMADHSDRDIDAFVEIAKSARRRVQRLTSISPTDTE